MQTWRAGTPLQDSLPPLSSSPFKPRLTKPSHFQRKTQARQIDGHLPCLHTLGTCQVSCVWPSVGCDLRVSAGLSLLTEG